MYQVFEWPPPPSSGVHVFGSLWVAIQNINWGIDNVHLILE